MTDVGKKVEPIGRVTRVPHVSTIDPGIVSGEIPVTVVAPSVDFDQFYDRTRPSVVRALAVTLGDVDLASDSVDEAMVRAYQRWRRIGALENPAGWVYRVALNHARGQLRRRRRPAPNDTDVAQHAGPMDPAIVDALAGLAVPYRAVVVCRLLLDWSERETAAALGVRPGTVKSRLSRALDQLGRRLRHLREEEER